MPLRKLAQQAARNDSRQGLSAPPTTPQAPPSTGPASTRDHFPRLPPVLPKNGGSGPFNPNGGSGPFFPGGGSTFPRTEYDQGSGPFFPQIPGSFPTTGGGAPPFYPPGIPRPDISTRDFPSRPGQGDSRTLPQRQPQQPWEQLRDKLFQQPWLMNGDTPPRTMIDYLLRRPEFMEALRNTPQLMDFFGQFLPNNNPQQPERPNSGGF